MQGSVLLAVAILVGLATGGVLGAQPSVNGHLGRNMEHPLQAAVISFVTGTAIILAITIFSGAFPPRFTVAPSSLPWWVWLGGSMGVVVVSTSLFFVPRVGSLPWFAALMTGQVIASLVLDHYGLLANPRSQISPMRLLGTVLMILGVLAIVQAKRTESSEPVANSDTQGVDRSQFDQNP